MGYLNEDDLLTIQCIVMGIADAKRTGIDHQNISMKTLEEIAGVIQKQQDIIKKLDAKVEDEVQSMTSKETLNELNYLIHESPERVSTEVMEGLKNAVKCIEDMQERIDIMTEGRWIPGDCIPEDGKYFVFVSHVLYGANKYYKTDFSVGKYENDKWKIAWYLDCKVLAYMPFPEEPKVGGVGDGC